MKLRLWRHQMETFSALLTLCVGNSPVTGEFPAQRVSNAELWRFLRYTPKPTVEQPTETLVIWHAIALIMTSLQCDFLALTHRQSPWSDIQHIDGWINYGLATQPTYLGLWVNNYPSWYDHILKLFRKTYYHSHMFRRLRKIIPSPLLHNLWHIEVLRAIKDNI